MIARDLWQRKPHLALGLRPRAWWVYCHKSLEPYYNYNISLETQNTAEILPKETSH